MGVGETYRILRRRRERYAGGCGLCGAQLLQAEPLLVNLNAQSNHRLTETIDTIWYRPDITYLTNWNLDITGGNNVCIESYRIE